MESDVRIEKVDAVQTRGGNTRYVVRDDQGREYTTFRPSIGAEAQKLEGRRARVEFHEDERNGFKNVWLDRVSAGEEPPDELFEKLEPFKRMVADDIRHRGDE